MIIKYLLFLGIGHILGDFYFQNKKYKKCKTETNKGILQHCFMYYVAVLLAVLPVFSIDMVGAATCVAFIHGVIDLAEYVIAAKKKIAKSEQVFLIDQCIHITCLCVVAYIMDIWHFSTGHIEIIDSIIGAFGGEMETIARWVLAILFIHRPVNVFIQNFLGDYKPKEEESLIKTDNKAGRRIGTVERLIMLIFLSVNQYTAIGFVLTAKSIARYDKISKDEKFAEYYLLGTLVSTLCVIVCRMLVIS